MQTDFMEEVDKKFISKNYIYEKEFDTTERIKILKEILDKEVLKEILSKNLNMLRCGIVLTRDQEKHLFRKYNYLKYRIYKISQDKKTGKLKKEKEIQKRVEDILRTREIIVKCNLRLIVKSVCKIFDKESFNYEDFFSNGYYHMLRAIDHFDYTKGFKFSTYFVNVLFRNLYRDKTKLYKDSSLEIEHQPISLDSYEDKNQVYNKKYIEKLIEKLDDYNCLGADVLKKVFGICGEEQMTKIEIARNLGVSKSTVHNIAERAIKKIREFDLVYDPLV